MCGWSEFEKIVWPVSGRLYLLFFWSAYTRTNKKTKTLYITRPQGTEREREEWTTGKKNTVGGKKILVSHNTLKKKKTIPESRNATVWSWNTPKFFFFFFFFFYIYIVCIKVKHMKKKSNIEIIIIIIIIIVRSLFSCLHLFRSLSLLYMDNTTHTHNRWWICGTWK